MRNRPCIPAQMRSNRIAARRICGKMVGMLKREIETQFGTLSLTEEDGEIVRLSWGTCGRHDASPVLDAAAAQLASYDAGDLTVFDLPLRVQGGELQRAVCQAMRDTPFGDTVTYGDIARTLGVSAQAVGQACGRNPIPIIIPCHRVMGARGLTGFSGAGGVETKLALLKHEGAGGFLI